MSYQTLDYYSAITHGCKTIEDVEDAELLGILPGGATEELQELFPTEEEYVTDQALRDYLFVVNEFITEEELVESYDNPALLRRSLMTLEPAQIYEFYTFLSSFQDDSLDIDSENE